MDRSVGSLEELLIPIRMNLKRQEQKFAVVAANGQFGAVFRPAAFGPLTAKAEAGRLTGDSADNTLTKASKRLARQQTSNISQ